MLTSYRHIRIQRRALAALLSLVRCAADAGEGSEGHGPEPSDDAAALASAPTVAGDEGSTLDPSDIGREVAVPRHLGDDEELTLPRLLVHGERLFRANWTSQEGFGRPLSKGTGAPLSDPGAALLFPRNMNRVSGPDANSCAGCHNAPFGIAGGGGDSVGNVFVLAQRFDFVTFAQQDALPTRGSLDEQLRAPTLDAIANSRATPGMFGAGYVEMLARQLTTELRALRDQIAPGQVRALTASGISFGELGRFADGSWDTRRVEGLPELSLRASPSAPPDLIVRPFHQSGRVASLREFTNNAYHHHHGIQAAERFGLDDPDGDGFQDELTRADVTAVVAFQAALPVPGRVIPRHPAFERAIAQGEQTFEDIGCADCHVPSLQLVNDGWVFSEPGPFNPEGNLQPGEAPELRLDLADPALPGARLPVRAGVVDVPAYTDFKLHDITSGPDDPNREPLDMLAAPGSDAFFAGNARFLTRRLWGVANEPPYFHHGKFTTLREAVEAHAGEAASSAAAYRALDAEAQAALIEFLKSLQVLPPGARSLVVDENNNPRSWRRDLYL